MLTNVSLVSLAAGEDWKWEQYGLLKSELKTCTPETRGDQDFWWIPYFQEKLKQPRKDLLFLGDFVTDFWTYAADHQYPGGLNTWNKRYKDIATNFGITGDKTQTVLWRLTEGKSLEGYTPKHIVLLIGINNLLQGDTPEEPIDRCKADVSLLSHIIISKYCDHLPLHRQVQMFQRHGIELPKSTMCDWVRDCAEVFRPLYNYYRNSVLSSNYVNVDDTPMDFMDRKRKEKGSRRGRMWAYLCRTEDIPEESANAPPGTKLMFFDFTENWSEDHPISMLKNFKGYLQTDAYAGFRKVTESPDVTALGCWAHCRRKFYQAAKIGVKEAEPFVTLINILYRIEHRISDLKDKEASDEYLLGLRRKRANRVMDRFFKKVKVTTLLPKSPLGKALTYSINQEQELRRYVDELRFSPDNNVVERNLRMPVIGKKNFVLLGSECGGKTAAILYTLIGTCRANGINAQEYIADVLARINTHPYSRLGELLPHNWQRLRK